MYKDLFREKYSDVSVAPWFDGQIWETVLKKQDAGKRKVLGFSPLLGRRPFKNTQAGKDENLLFLFILLIKF